MVPALKAIAQALKVYAKPQHPSAAWARKDDFDGSNTYTSVRCNCSGEPALTRHRRFHVACGCAPVTLCEADVYLYLGTFVLMHECTVCAHSSAAVVLGACCREVLWHVGMRPKLRVHSFLPFSAPMAVSLFLCMLQCANVL